jgi:hypothetical protein
LGQSWAYGIVGYPTGHFLQPPNPQDPTCSTNATGASMNPGSFNMTSHQTIWSLGSIAQGEIIFSDVY